MKYLVQWRRPAVAAMAELLRELPDRRPEFTAALDELYDKLSTAPNDVGESRDGPYRIGFFGRLSVRFRPSPEEKTVYVVAVHLPFDRLKPE
jgi:hypothetical protein